MFWEAVWWIYLVIPGYAIYKAWTGFIRPYMLSSSDQEQDPNTKSKRQQKKLRQETAGTAGKKSKTLYR
ncbi:hypothetical protein G9A89_013440 [Geosiphon pyriformis]|nr:hypothetical protein G9A89_013440 [Geosiphon pyriformis]